MAPSDDSDVEVFDGIAQISVGDVFLVAWRSGATAARIDWVHERVRRHLARNADDMVSAQFLLSSATPPGLGEVGSVRAGLRTVLPRARRLVVVPLGDAAWVSVVRGVMRAGLALPGQSELIKVAPSAAAAMKLLGDARSPVTPPSEALQLHLRALLGAVDAPSSALPS